jgi:hypothetical protein
MTPRAAGRPTRPSTPDGCPQHLLAAATVSVLLTWEGAR